MVTDGQASDPEVTLQRAAELRRLGFSVLALGVGDRVDPTELAAIASSPENVFTVSNYDALDTLESAVVNISCTATPPPPGE